MSDFDKLPPECDVLCEWRECLHKGHNKGAYTPGRGYTRYYDKPEYVCMTRMQHGCPPRELPNTGKMLKDLYAEILDTKCSTKAKKLLRKMYIALSLIGEFK